MSFFSSSFSLIFRAIGSRAASVSFSFFTAGEGSLANAAVAEVVVAAGVVNEVVAVDTAVEVVVTVEVAEELTVAVDTAVLGVVFVAGVGRVTGNGGPVLGVWLNPSIAECLSIAKQVMPGGITVLY